VELGQFEFGELFRNATGGKHFCEVGDMIADKMKEPILARINQARERAS
jgi:hypothetical protein